MHRAGIARINAFGVVRLITTAKKEAATLMVFAVHTRLKFNTWY
jgi:hypothetical protein